MQLLKLQLAAAAFFLLVCSWLPRSLHAHLILEPQQELIFATDSQNAAASGVSLRVNSAANNQTSSLLVAPPIINGINMTALQPLQVQSRR